MLRRDHHGALRMKTATRPRRIAACAAFATAIVLALPVHARAQGVALAPHRAIYDLKLGQSKGNRSLAAVRGRIVYDFSGSACEGYSLSFRQVTELDNGEGKVAV